MGPPGHHLGMVGPFSPGGDHPGGMGGPPHMERTSSGPRPPGPGRVLTFIDLLWGLRGLLDAHRPTWSAPAAPARPAPVAFCVARFSVAALKGSLEVCWLRMRMLCALELHYVRC